MNHPIHPPTPILTEIQHIAAYRKYLLEEIVWNDLFVIYLARKDPQKWNSVDAEKELSKLLKKLFNDNHQDVCYDGIESFENFKKTWGTEYISEAHGGDCTGLAGACIRCHAEDWYDLSSTVSWKDKAEGHKLMYEYDNLNKKGNLK